MNSSKFFFLKGQLPQLLTEAAAAVAAAAAAEASWVRGSPAGVARAGPAVGAAAAVLGREAARVGASPPAAGALGARGASGLELPPQPPHQTCYLLTVKTLSAYSGGLPTQSSSCPVPQHPS